MDTTITLDRATKERLAALKGGATWDEYLAKIADLYPPDEVLRELAARMESLAAGRERALDLSLIHI